MTRTKSIGDLQGYKGINLNLQRWVLPDRLDEPDRLYRKYSIRASFPAPMLGCRDYYAGNPIIEQENDRIYYAR